MSPGSTEESFWALAGGVELGWRDGTLVAQRPSYEPVPIAPDTVALMHLFSEGCDREAARASFLDAYSTADNREQVSRQICEVLDEWRNAGLLVARDNDPRTR